MKNFIFAILIILGFSISISYSQTIWTPPQKLTNGFVDRNPSFGSKYFIGVTFNLYSSEYLIFERYINTYSQICVLRLGTTTILDSVIYLTTNSFLKRNPSISYYSPSYLSNITKAIALWESNEKGKWDIFGKCFNGQTGWGNVFPFDTSTGNKSKPRSVRLDSMNYLVVYEKNGDIILKKFNPFTQVISYDTNLTATDTAFCSNPYAYFSPTSQNSYVVTFEKRKPDNKFAIYFRKSNALPVWTAPDTIAFLGNNIFDSFTISNFSYPTVIFESDRNGYSDIYATSLSNPLQQEKVFTSPTNPGFDYKNFVYVYYPIITDYIGFNVCAYTKRKSDSTKVMFSSRGYPLNDSTTICDTSKKTSITMNGGIYNLSWYSMIWVIFNKDSASYSNLWARRININLTEIKKISEIVPTSFSLSQNYPNPFNSNSKIKMQISKLSDVKLIVYNILGKEVSTLVNEKLNPGTYEIIFDGSNLPSGVYFNKLTAGDFSDTKKMILMK